MLKDKLMEVLTMPKNKLGLEYTYYAIQEIQKRLDEKKKQHSELMQIMFETKINMNLRSRVIFDLNLEMYVLVDDLLIHKRKLEREAPDG